MDISYPIGQFEAPNVVTRELIELWTDEIKTLPERLQAAVKHLSEEQLNTPYRPDGWTVKQVVHHIADAHMNALIRIKLALTEHVPTIKPFDEQKWAELSDNELPVTLSLSLIQSLHAKLVHLVATMQEDELVITTFIHPEWGIVTIGDVLAKYAWHGNHHLAQITTLCSRMKW